MTTIVSGSSITFNDNTTQNTSAYGGGFAMRNRIINGDCRIDQRNAGASVTPANGQYTLDRWRAAATVTSKFSVQQSSTAPTGFVNSLLVTSLDTTTTTGTNNYAIQQFIEGFNTSDLGWGTANAQNVTLSFWTRSSLTGTFGGAIQNNGQDRSYPFSYTISSANTWEYKTITISGETTGTWLTTNGIGMRVFFGLGAGSSVSGTAGAWASVDYRNVTGATSVVGTNGATFYITGVQLEKGSTATSFDYRPYGQELALCQRYYETCFPVGTAPANGTHSGVYSDGFNGWCAFNTTTARAPVIRFAVTKRASPTLTLYNSSATATSGSWGLYNGSSWVAVTTTAINVQTDAAEIGASSLTVTANYVYLMNGLWAASSEL